MTWETFIYFAIPAVISWAAGAYFAFKNKTTSAYLFTIAGILIFAAYIAGMWISGLKILTQIKTKAKTVLNDSIHLNFQRI